MTKEKREESIGEKEGILITKDKYAGRPIKYIEREDRYDLIFADVFSDDRSDFVIYADLLNDIKESDKSKEIHLWVNSMGGSVTILMMLSSLIEEFEHVVSIGLGEVDSAGFNFWCLGKERYIGEHTTCLYHSVSGESFGKSSEMNELSLFMMKYQGEFERMVSDILTEEEIKKGRYTELFFLGRELIDRGVALPYNKYSHREKFVPISAYRYDEEIYVSVNGLYHSVEISDIGKKRSDIVLNRLEYTKNIVDIREIINEIGINFINFFQLYTDIRVKRIQEGFLVYKEDLLKSWENYDEEEIDEETLFNKFVEWVKKATVFIHTLSGNSICLKVDNG